MIYTMRMFRCCEVKSNIRGHGERYRAVGGVNRIQSVEIINRDLFYFFIELEHKPPPPPPKLTTVTPS